MIDGSVNWLEPHTSRRVPKRWWIVCLVVFVVLFGAVSFGVSVCFAAFDSPKLVVRGISNTVIYDGEAHSVPGLEDADEHGVVRVVGSDEKVYFVSGLKTEGRIYTPDDSGPVAIVGEAEVHDENDNVVTDKVSLSLERGQFDMKPRDLYLESANVSKKFDGTELVNGDTDLVCFDGLAKGDSVSFSFTGSQIYPGSSSNSFDVSFSGGTDESCYSVHKKEGVLKVEPLSDTEKISFSVEGRSDEVPWDGVEHKFSALEATSFTKDVGKISLDIVGLSVAEAKGTKSGKYESKISKSDDFAIYLSSDKEHTTDISDQCNVTFKSGFMTVLPADLYVATFFGSDYDWTDGVFVSRDCETFKLVGSCPVEMRDPSILWHDGRFWTVVCRNDMDGHLWLELSSSSDLIHWTEPCTSGPFSLDVLPDVGGEDYNVVAPEWFKDTDGQIYIIVSCGWWGYNHGVDRDDHMQTYLLHVNSLYFDGTRSMLSSFGPAQRMLLAPDGADRIDGTIDHIGNKYYLTVKRDGLNMELWENSTLNVNGWKRVRDKALYGFEAPCVISVGTKFRMFADGVPDVEPYGVRMWESASIDGKWVEKPVKFVDENGLDMGIVRHGTVLPVSYSKDRAAWNAVNGLL